MALLANNKKKKGEQWLLRFQQVTSTVQIAFIGKAPEISIPICIRLPYMTAIKRKKEKQKKEKQKHRS